LILAIPSGPFQRYFLTKPIEEGIMKVNRFLLATMICSSFAQGVLAQSIAKRCPVPSANEVYLSQGELERKLTSEIVLMTPGLVRRDVEYFLYEYDKYPRSLRNEMTAAGGKIHLLQGEGVTVDPSWGNSIFTKDGRDWSRVPGSGGFIYSYPSHPTRLVVNHLYDRHGSVNLILHEHSHTMDHIYSERNISGSKAWRNILQNEENENVIRSLCGYYCLTDERESFAELFAYYHACETTKRHLEEVLPPVADFMRNLTSVKSFMRTKDGQKYVRNQSGDQSDDNQSHRQEAQPRKKKRKTLGEILKDIFGGIEAVFE
jgi:hypothetical protein